MFPSNTPSLVVGGGTDPRPIPAAAVLGDLEHQLGNLTDLTEKLQNRLQPFLGIMDEPTGLKVESVPSQGSSQFVSKVSTLTDILRSNIILIKRILGALEI